MVDKIENPGKYWLLYVICGILITLVGVIFFARLGIAFVTVEIMVAIYFIISGIVNAIATVVDRKLISLWGLKLVLHIFVVLAGVWMLVSPMFGFSFLWILCSIGFMFDGIALIMSSIAAKQLGSTGTWVLMLVLGILIVLLSFGFFSDPTLTGIFVSICAAFATTFYGISNIVLGVKLKSFK